MIHGSCSDYRAAASIDFEHDKEDLDKKITSSTLVLYGESGTLAESFDIPDTWQKRCQNVETASIPGGHFFVDVFPNETTNVLLNFLSNQ